jgi:predicted TIM-barrel fold metal-dependent hydrolase
VQKEKIVTRPLITTDCHITPPLDLADELPEAQRSQVPHLETRDDGVFLVRPNLLPDTMKGTDMGNMMTRMLEQGVKIEDVDDEPAVARVLQGDCCDAATPGFTAKSFITDLERDGVVGAVLIGSSAFGISDDLDADIAYTRLVNDWIHDEFKDELHRFAPGISLPLGDVDASVKELERAAGLGLRPALLPDVIAAKPYVLPEWEPLWEAAESLGVPLQTHVGTSRGIEPWTAMTAHQYGQGATTAFAMVSVGMAETVAWFACSGILERHPDLKVVMTECSAGWLAWAMHFFDHHYFGRFGGEFLTKQGYESMKQTEMPPSYYIKRQISCTFMDDPVAIHNREFTGLECLMWGNDYPHEEGVFPDSQEWVEKQFSGVPEEEILQIVHDNAAEVFGLTV